MTIKVAGFWKEWYWLYFIFLWSIEKYIRSVVKNCLYLVFKTHSFDSSISITAASDGSTGTTSYKKKHFDHFFAVNLINTKLPPLLEGPLLLALLLLSSFLLSSSFLPASFSGMVLAANLLFYNCNWENQPQKSAIVEITFCLTCSSFSVSFLLSLSS